MEEMPPKKMSIPVALLWLTGIVLLWLFVHGELTSMHESSSAAVTSNELIAKNPVKCSAKVTKLHKEVGGRNNQPWILYQFQVDGKTYEGKAFTEKSEGSPCSITYCKSNPGLNCLGDPAAQIAALRPSFDPLAFIINVVCGIGILFVILSVVAPGLKVG